MILHKSKVLIFSLLILLFWVPLRAQQTAVYDEPEASFRLAGDLYNKGLYGAAKDKYDRVIAYYGSQQSEMKTSAEYYSALCAVELFNDDAERQLLRFIEEHPESAYLKKVYFKLGVFKYRKKSYRSVIRYFQRVDVYELSKNEQAEYYFKLGYSYFKRKKLEQAKKAFFEIKERDSKYKNLAIYYYSHIAYVEHHYETALKGFLSIKDVDYFKPVIPYYVAHIYYMQKNYDELLKVARGLYEVATPKRQAEIARMIGEAYFNKKDYALATPWLEKAMAAGHSTPESQYQIAYCYYRAGMYSKAIDYFKHLSSGMDSMAQNANYHLAMCYLKTGQKKYALNAFQYAWRAGISPDITEDALYNFAKLSYELSYNPYNQAIHAFNKYLSTYPGSAHAAELTEYLAKMYVSSRNYLSAKASIEKLKQRSPEMNSAYQRILYALGVQEFNKNNFTQAIQYFNQTAQLKYNKFLIPKAIYWTAESYYRLGDYPKSISIAKRFLITPGALITPFYNRANYNIAYAWFKQQDFKNADLNFRIFLRNATDTTARIYQDAHLRLADCYFMNKDLEQAIAYYEKAIRLGNYEADYALYKEAEAYGAMGKWKDKVQTLKRLINTYPRSDYLGNAELAMAKTYFNQLNNPQEAIQHYQHIIDSYPPQRNFVKKAMLDLGLVYSNLGQDEKAIEVWKQVNKNYKGTPESKGALEAMREAYVNLNRVDDFFNYVKSLGMQPSANQQDSVSYMAAEKIYLGGDCDRSSQSFQEYLTRFPAGVFVANAHFYMADCEFRASLFNQALQDYTYITSLPVSAFTEKSWERIAYIWFYKKEDYTKALEAYTKLKETAEFKANKEVAKIGIMRSLWLLGDTTRALPAAEEVLTIDNLEETTKIEAMMIKGKALLAQGNDSLAMEVLQQIIASSASEASAQARYIIALEEFNKGNYDKAESIVYDIIQQEPSYEYWVVKAFILSADIFVKTDNKHQAEATLQSVVNNYTGDQALLNEAKAKLKALHEQGKEVKEQKKEDDLIIELNDNLDDYLFDQDAWDDENE